MDGTEFHDVTITVEDDKEDKIVVKDNGDELRVETFEEGSLEEIQISMPVNILQVNKMVEQAAVATMIMEW